MNKSPQTKRVLFIVPYPIGEAPSQRFRFEQYFDILHQKAFYFKTASFWSAKSWTLLYKPGHGFQKTMALLAGIFNRFILLFHIPGFELVFIHREAMPIGPPVIEFIISKILKKKIIYDFDDAIWLPNTSDQNSIAYHLKFHQKVKWICKWSWKVSCGNTFLAEFARHFNGQVALNPTTIDTDYHCPKAIKNPGKLLTIGWTGTHSTTKYLLPLAPVLKELRQKHKLKVMVISNQPPAWDLEDYQFVPWHKDKEIEQLRQIDIGIMPLEDTIWEQGKCGFKALQYMALGIPAVASDVGVNRQIIQHGINGFLCSSLSDWSAALSGLVASEATRKALGSQGRQSVLDHYSVISNSGTFLSLFE